MISHMKLNKNLISIVFKIKFETNLKFYFVSYNTKNNIMSLKILFVGYIKGEVSKFTKSELKNK